MPPRESRRRSRSWAAGSSRSGTWELLKSRKRGDFESQSGNLAAHIHHRPVGFQEGGGRSDGAMPTPLLCHQKLSSEAAMSPPARRSQRCLVIGGCLKPFPKFHEMGGIFSWEMLKDTLHSHHLLRPEEGRSLWAVILQ